MQETITMQKVAWSVAEISEATGLSIGFLRSEVRTGRLPVKKFGRRVLILDSDLRNYLAQGSQKDAELSDAAA
jgi:excisionase family DNA binding protein